MHLVGLVGYSLLLRKSLLQSVDRFTLATVMQTGIAIPAVVIYAVLRPSFASYDPKLLLVMSIAVLLIVVFHYSNVRALQYLEASVYSVLYNLRILFTTVLGVAFLGERLVWLRILGGVLILAAIFVVRQKGSKSLYSKGMEWAVAAGLLVSLLNMTEKYMIGELGYAAYIVPVMVLTTIVMWCMLILRKQKSDLSIFIQTRMLALMALRSISAYGFTLAFAVGGLLSVSSYISSLSVILIVILGVLLLDERDYLRQKIIATALAVIGLTFILASRF